MKRPGDLPHLYRYPETHKKKNLVRVCLFLCFHSSVPGGEQARGLPACKEESLCSVHACGKRLACIVTLRGRTHSFLGVLTRRSTTDDGRREVTRRYIIHVTLFTIHYTRRYIILIHRDRLLMIDLFVVMTQLGNNVGIHVL